MRELKLKYILELYSDLGKKATSDAKLLATAQDAIRKELSNTETKLTRLGSVMERLGGVHGASVDRQSQYWVKVAQSADRARQAALGYLEATKKIQGVAIAGAAAAWAVSSPVKKAVSYDERLAHMANTAFNDRDGAGRKIGAKRLEAAVNNARKFGGGTREQSAEALDTMLASGVLSPDDSIAMLPAIVKAATASGADANALAMIAIRAKQIFKISAADLPQILSAAIRGGQAGGFELKDMSKWLPEQMAMANNLGITGKDGLAKLIAWNQASVITSGTKDQAGNNLRDLLNDINTPHFRNFMAQSYLNGGHHLKRGEKESTLQSIDDIFLNYQKSGINKVDATIDMMGKIFAKNKRYQALQSQLEKLDPKDEGGKLQIYQAMTAQVQGTEIGKVFHNQQSLMAVVALMNNKQYVEETLKTVRGQYALPEAKSETSNSFGVVADTTAFKLEQAGEAKKLAEKAAVDGISTPLGRLADGAGALAETFPKTTGAAVLLGMALTAAAGAAAMFTFAAGGKGAGGLFTKIAGVASVALSSMGAMGGGAVGTAASFVARRVLPLAGMAYAGKDLYDIGDALYQLHGATHRDGARLSSDARGWRGRGYQDPRLLGLTEAQLAGGGGTFAVPSALQIGQGALDINVRVVDGVITATPQVTQQPSLIHVSAGATNPAGYAKP